MPVKELGGEYRGMRIGVPDKTVKGALAAIEIDAPEAERISIVVNALTDEAKKLLGERRLRSLPWKEVKREVERLVSVEKCEEVLMGLNPEWTCRAGACAELIATTWAGAVDSAREFLPLREAVAFSLKTFDSFDNRLRRSHDEHFRFHLSLAASKGKGEEFITPLLIPRYEDPVADLHESFLTKQLDAAEFENLKKLVVSLKVNEQRVSVKRRFVIFSEAIEKYTMHGSSHRVDMDFFKLMTFSLLPSELRCLVGQKLFADEGFCFRGRYFRPEPTPTEDRTSYWHFAHLCVNAISGWMPDEELETQFKAFQTRSECSELVEYLAQYDTIGNRATFDVFLPNFKFLTKELMDQKKLTEHEKWVCILAKLASPVRRVTEAKIHASNKENSLDENMLFRHIADALDHYITLDEMEKVHAKLIAINEVDKFQWNAPVAKAFDPKKY